MVLQLCCFRSCPISSANFRTERPLNFPLRCRSWYSRRSRIAVTLDTMFCVGLVGRENCVEKDRSVLGEHQSGLGHDDPTAIGLRNEILAVMLDCDGRNGIVERLVRQRAFVFVAFVNSTAPHPTLTSFTLPIFMVLDRGKIFFHFLSQSSHSLADHRYILRFS